MLITKIRNRKFNDRYGSSTTNQNQLDMNNSFHHYGFHPTNNTLTKHKKYSLNSSLPRLIGKQTNEHNKSFNSDVSFPYLNQSLQKSRFNHSDSPLIKTNSHSTFEDQSIIIPTFPMKPSEVLFYYSSKLSEYEKKELYGYDEIYFLGLESEKINSLNPKDYDDEHGYYRKVFKDHINYRYEIFDTLGKGSFGLVLRCYDHKCNEFIALKMIKNKKRFEKQGLVEINLLKYLKSLDQQNSFHIVQFKEFFYFRSHLCITFELLGINLYQLMKKNNYQGFSIDLIKRFAKSLLQSLWILSKENIIHCDLKPENILLKEKGSSQIKLIDFGSGCFQSQRIYTYIQSRFYRAPEVILGIEYTPAIDMWSFACIILELFLGYPIFPGENEEEQMSMIMEVIDLPPIHILEQGTRTKLFFDSKGRPRLSSKKLVKIRRPGTRSIGEIARTNDQDLIDLIVQCLQWDPLIRLTPGEALSHPWINQKRLDRHFKSRRERKINEQNLEEKKDESINI